MVLLARYYEDIRVYGVDHFLGSEKDDPKLYVGLSHEGTVANLRRIGIEPREYTIIVSDTAQAAAQFDHVNYVYLDGDHTPKWVCGEIEAWYPKIVPGGYIGGHDWELETVRQAVRKYFVPEVVGESWLVRK